MKADARSIERAVARPPADLRVLLLYGPDEAGSNALCAKFAAAMGDCATRIDIDSATLKEDPARLADEAASFSMFGDRQWVRVGPAGEEALSGVAAVLDAPQAGNPVVVLAGALKKTSKLLALCLSHPAALAFASYAPEGMRADQLARDMGAALGLKIDADLAHRLVDCCGGDRALLRGELTKLALYHDASPETPVAASHEAFSMLAAEAVDHDVFAVVHATLTGDVDALRSGIARVNIGGGRMAGVLRLIIGRTIRLAAIRAALDRGVDSGRAFATGGPPMFDRARKQVEAELARWTASGLSRAVGRLLEAERASRLAVAGSADTVIAQELLMIARQAAKGR